MTSNRSPRQTGEEFRAANPHLKDFLPFLDLLRDESHRGSVLVSCSFLEEQLRAIITAFLIETSEADKLLSGSNAPIGTFAARITAAFCLGLISPAEHEDCNTLRKIRNEFAHRVDASFKDQRLIDLTSRLHHSAKSYGDVVVSPARSFSTAAVGLISNLTNRAHYVSQERLKARSWRP